MIPEPPVLPGASVTVIPEPRQRKDQRVQRTKTRTLGQRVAERIKRTLGSWAFLLTQTGIIIVWMVWNHFRFFGVTWDPAPFLLLNVVLSLQAAYTGPVLQMTSNWQDEADAERDNHEADEVDALFAMQAQQNQIAAEILELQHGQLAILQRLDALLPTTPKDGQ